MTNASSGSHRYLAIWFPFLPTDRLAIEESARPDPAGAPLVLVEKVKGALRIAAPDPQAHQMGLFPGLALADARSRVPDLRAVEHDPYADELWLGRLCEGCYSYTPNAATDPPDGLILDISGCTHLFGDEEALAADLRARLARLGMLACHACAGTGEAARALVRHGWLQNADEAAAVRALPVEALGLDGEAALALKRAGLVSIGDLAERPWSALAARFGGGAVVALERLLGLQRKPMVPRRKPLPLIVERRFAEPIGRSEDALGVLSELAVDAARILAERGQGGRRFEARLFRTDGLAPMLAIETGMPTRDPGAIMRLFRERVETLADPLDPGFGFDLVRLSIPRVELLAPGQLALGGGEAVETEIAALIDRLATRLGRDRLIRFAPQDTHIPEQAQLAIPAIDARAPACWAHSEPGEPPLRPLHLFDPPQPIEVIAQVPDGPPHRFRWRGSSHEMTRFEGPERIAAEWWRRKDGKGRTRDYYRIEDACGRRFWVFRHGLYGKAKHPCWYLHGLFA